MYYVSLILYLFRDKKYIFKKIEKMGKNFDNFAAKHVFNVSPNCRLCHHVETYEHMYWDCKNVQLLWKNLWKELPADKPELDRDRILKGRFGEEHSPLIGLVSIVKRNIRKSHARKTALRAPEIRNAVIVDMGIERAIHITAQQAHLFDQKWKYLQKWLDE